MKLISVYAEPDAAKILYELLGQRFSYENISHKTMPCWAGHVQFYKSKPYDRWHLIRDDNNWLGSIYVTHNREIGIHIFPEHQRKGAGSWALAKMRAFYSEPLLANINPENEKSKRFFERHGFKLLQETYQSE